MAFAWKSVNYVFFNPSVASYEGHWFHSQRQRLNKEFTNSFSGNGPSLGGKYFRKLTNTTFVTMSGSIQLLRRSGITPGLQISLGNTLTRRLKGDFLIQFPFLILTDRSNENGTLVNKYCWNEGSLNGDKIHQKCC